MDDRSSPQAQRWPTITALVLQHWVVCLLLPVVLGCAAVGATFLLPRTYVASGLVTAMDMMPANSPVHVPFGQSSLYLQFFRSDDIVEGLIEKFHLDGPPWHMDREEILDTVLNVEQYYGPMFERGNAVRVEVKASSRKEARQFIDYVTATGTQQYRRTLDRLWQPLLEEMQLAFESAESHYDKLRAQQEEFAKQADIAEVKRRVDSELELYAWREETRQREKTEMDALDKKMDVLEEVLAAESPTLELKRALAREPLLLQSAAKESKSNPADLLGLQLTETTQNPSYLKARGAMIEAQSRKSWIEGYLASMKATDEQNRRTLNELGDALIDKQHRREQLDHQIAQAEKRVDRAHSRLVALQQMPWPPQRLVALPVTVQRERMAKLRLGVGAAVFLGTFVLMTGIVTIRQRRRELTSPSA